MTGNSIAQGTGGGANGLPPAHALASLGMPIVCGRLDAAGDPDTDDLRWKRWQRQTPGARSLKAADSWKEGEALAGVTGVVYDVLDVDPRNGGTESLRELSDELGDDGPEVYWTIRTPRGGSHLYVAPLGIGSRNGFRPGLDLKGGNADGSGRGFVFLPPTERYGKRYVVVESGGAPNGSGASSALRNWIERSLSGGATTPSASGRVPARVLRARCLAAGDGEQRRCLLAYVHELERAGVGADGIIAKCRSVMKEMPSYPSRKGPWFPARRRDPDFWIKDLMHGPGEVIGDATAAEAAVIRSLDGGNRPLLVRRFSSIESEVTSWLWELYLARGEISLIDGEKAVGKSATWLDVAARGSVGAPMPGAESAITGPFDTLILSPENRVRHTIRPRLEAAGANHDRIWTPEIRPVRRGAKADTMFLLPESAETIRRMIRESGASLLIIDPIVAFLSPEVNSHNDASVRMALSPLSEVLASEDCAAGFSRNMNKNTGQVAKDRGSGSRAFADLARVHLLAMRLPADYTGPGEFGLSFGDTNLTRREDRVLAFDIGDSSVPLDDKGRFVSRVTWHGLVSLPGRAGRRGPSAIVQEQIVGVLMEMFEACDTWKAAEGRAQLKAAGVSCNPDTVAKAMESIGARHEPAFRPEGGISHWIWTVAPKKTRPRRRG